MIRFDPNIFVSRLVVRRDLNVLYDEDFHRGVNVIRGANSSGKSTILNFLFYGLGGDLNRSDWSEHALQCTHVWLEVEFNGKPAVLKREIDQSSRSGMDIFGGRYSDAVKAPIENWLRFPYSRGSKESFSQAIFRLLDMPDVAVEGTSSITMHQVLRLLYADQMTPIESLFRFEGYDPENLREAVGNLLCGAFDAEIYELQQLYREKDRQFSAASSDLKSIFKIVGGDESLGLDWVLQKRKSLEDERAALLNSIDEAESAMYDNESTGAISLTSSQKLYAQVSTLQNKLNVARLRVDSVELDIADSNEFVQSLERRLEALRDSESASEIVEIVNFAACPACYAEVLEETSEIHACHLCKTPFDHERIRDRIVDQMNDIAVQLRQSKQLQDIRRDRLTRARTEYESLYDEWKRKAAELSALNVRPTSTLKEKVRTLHRQLGYIDKTIEDTDKQLQLANKIGDLSATKALLDEQMQDLAIRIEIMKKSQTEQLSLARRKIEMETISLLKGDLIRQDSFENPRRVDFSFGKNNISVDDHTYFSASSRVVLKSSFLVAFLSAAIKEPSFRHPRFLMIDITEDKGMEMERSHNFQEQVANLSDAAISEHQIILATAMPSPKLDESLFVGRFSTKVNGTLNFVSK
ncbi:AAA domain-containing protein [Sulfitobacter pontiacus]|uniref:AAA domain-containing protein n=1 Tax=Sulfitobacter pontiacus TaxID=60137 RepID=A0A1H2R805_9RHOB|nr:ATP-binding protein [Sulfitobacter pontiacus]SDW15260.1 AAA domain-containing protein [Sulfitobacter pontiacus]